MYGHQEKGCHETPNGTHSEKRNTAPHYTHVDSIIGALTWAYSVDLTRVNLLAFLKSTEEGGYALGAVCLCVCPSDYWQTCTRMLTQILLNGRAWLKAKLYNFVGHPDHAS